MRGSGEMQLKAFCLSTAALGLSLALGTPARAADPQSFSCTFKAGAAYAYDKGRFKTERASPLTFKFAAIDAEKQAAQLTTARGGAGVRVMRAVNALHFIEVVGEGFMNVTTVYDRDERRKAHPAVHSRHFGLLGQPIVAQYRGYCSAE